MEAAPCTPTKAPRTTTAEDAVPRTDPPADAVTTGDQSTPFTQRRRTGLENKHAKYDHEMHSHDIRAVVVASYVTDALGFVSSIKSKDPGARVKHDSVLKAIQTGRDVTKALRALPLDAGILEHENYAPTVMLLNCISLSYHRHVYGGTRAVVIFGSMPNSAPGGDYLGLDIKADYYAYIGTVEELRAIITGQRSPALKPHSECIQFAEHKRPLNAGSADGQLKSNLCANKRYRPDLPVVHSFSIEKGNVRLASMNACGMSISLPAPWVELNSWIAHVALLYETNLPLADRRDPRKQRDQSLKYCSAQHDFYRWDVTSEEGKTIAVTPFYVSPTPGRTTFAGFDVLEVPKGTKANDSALLDDMTDQFNNGSVEGFWKMSWQTVSSRPTELELLSELHQDGWVPGLVRPFELKRIEKEPPKTYEAQGTTDAVQSDDVEAVVADAKTSGKEVDPALQAKLDARLEEQADRAIYHPSVKPDCVGKNIGRVKEILHLASIGQPLSQCKTAGDLLNVMYDLIEVHSHLCELGVLHRDVSWYNVMCNPKHLVKLHPLLQTNKVLPRPCINQILGERDPEPCVLLADLDHGIKLDGTATRHPGEKTGTPMFISAELSQPACLKFLIHDFDWLREDLVKAEEYSDAFKLAFPDEDGEFMRNFDKVVAEEKLRLRRERKEADPPPLGRHDRRHDAESIYWVFLWAFARARPLHASLIEPEALLASLTQFSTAMFHHTVGPGGDAGRGVFLVSPNQLNGLFHPLLKPFEELFVRMARYLTIPWYLYCGGDESPRNIMKADHVHVAFRRLALAFILDPANDRLRHTPLDTQLPRYTGYVDSRVRKQPVTEARRMETGATGSASRHTASRTGTRGSMSQATRTGTQGSMSQATRTGTQGSTTSLKRKAESEAIHPSKRKPSELSDAADTADENDYPLATAPADNDIPMDDCAQDAAPIDKSTEADELPEEYDASLHCDSESAAALRLMFWKDRMLWFGAGVDPNPKPQKEIAA